MSTLVSILIALLSISGIYCFGASFINLLKSDGLNEGHMFLDLALFFSPALIILFYVTVYDYSSVIASLLIVILLIGLVIGVYMRSRYLKKYSVIAKKKIDFYTTCKSLDIGALNTDEKIQKAAEIADNLGLSYINIKLLYEESKDYFKFLEKRAAADEE